jgi:hypothetical protein
MNQRDTEERVRRRTWPAPSPGLRDRILSSAVLAPTPVTWSDRMWFSRAWRMAAVATVLAVIALDQVSGAGRSTSVPPTMQATANAQAIDDAGRQVGLPPDVAASLAQRVLSDASRQQSHVLSAATLQQLLESGGDR